MIGEIPIPDGCLTVLKKACRSETSANELSIAKDPSAGMKMRLFGSLNKALFGKVGKSKLKEELPNGKFDALLLSRKIFPPTMVVRLAAEAFTRKPVSKPDITLLITVGLALTPTSMPISPAEGLPTTVLFTIRPKGTGPGISPFGEASPENKIPPLPAPTITLLLITDPGSNRLVFWFRNSRATPGFGNSVPERSEMSVRFRGLAVARTAHSDESEMKFESITI